MSGIDTNINFRRDLINLSASTTYHDFDPNARVAQYGALSESTTASGVATVTGMVSGAAGRLFFIVQESGGSLVLKHENVGSAAANRFVLSGAADVTLGGTNQGVMLLYVGSRWTRCG